MHYSLLFENNIHKIGAEVLGTTGTPDASSSSVLKAMVTKALREDASLPIDLDSLSFEQGKAVKLCTSPAFPNFIHHKCEEYEPPRAVTSSSFFTESVLLPALTYTSSVTIPKEVSFTTAAEEPGVIFSHFMFKTKQIRKQFVQISQQLPTKTSIKL